MYLNYHMYKLRFQYLVFILNIHAFPGNGARNVC